MTSTVSPGPPEIVLATPRGSVALPAFLPDATRASVRGVDALDLRAVGIEAVMVNTLHLAQRPGMRNVKRVGGLHRFMGWDVVIALDDCTGPDDPPEAQRAATDRTVRWFRQARDAYDRQCRQRAVERPPLLVGVVQGGTDPELRRRCVDALIDAW